ncbi:MAG: tetratricopeptide repeat protein [Thermoplasmata archaeon]
MPAFVGLAILFAVPAAALDVGVEWGLENAPTVVTLEAVDVSQDAAVLQGSLGGLGGETSVQVSFEWGPSPALGRETTPEAMSAPGTFETSIGDLSPGTNYYYRAKAQGNGTALGETSTFQTAPAAFAGDLFSQLWLWLVLLAIATIMGFLLTRRRWVARRRKGEAGASLPQSSEAAAAKGGLFGKVGSVFGVAGQGRGRTEMAGLGAAIGTGEPREIICPHCGTRLERAAVSCFGCGRVLGEGADTKERLGIAREALEANERDRDALFTVGAMLAASGETSEALEVLNRLSMLDPSYPGLWWVKSRVFENMGNSQAAEAAMVRAMRDDDGGGVAALLTAAGQVEEETESEGRDASTRTGEVRRRTETLPTRTEIAKARKAGLQGWCRELGLSDEGVVADLRVRLLGLLEGEARVTEVVEETSIEGGDDEGLPNPETCPHCETALEPETGNCPGCGRSVLGQGEALEAKVTRALAILDLDENDTDALFTLGAYLLLDDKVQEALDTLNRLTLLDPEYPGLWWVKAQVFEKLGLKKAVESALERAQQATEDLGVGDE